MTSDTPQTHTPRRTGDGVFQLDPRLAADTMLLLSEAGVEIRLMNDARWPWLILVPQMAGIEDVDQMTEEMNARVFKLARRASATLKQQFPHTSSNVATLGNVVKQFHLHVVARREGDANWPGPVWGHGTAAPYGETEAVELCERFKTLWQG